MSATPISCISRRYAGRHVRHPARPHRRRARRDCDSRLRHVSSPRASATPPRWPTPRPTPGAPSNASAARCSTSPAPTTPPSRRMADASERYTAASSQIDQATTARQALLAKESAMEGLYYVRAARVAMGIDPGPELESLTGQRSAGTVTEDRRIQFEGKDIEASPSPSQSTPNYYPGGRVAGRPVPAGWYSEPWWKPALVAGAWGIGSVLLFDALFSGMGGVDYGAQGFERATATASSRASTKASSIRAGATGAATAARRTPAATLGRRRRRRRLGRRRLRWWRLGWRRRLRRVLSPPANKPSEKCRFWGASRPLVGERSPQRAATDLRSTR